MEGEDDDYYIHEKNMNGAFHEDTVLMQVLDDHPTSGRRKEGKIIKILERGIKTVVGTLQKNQNFGFVIPDNLRFDSDIFVSKSQCKNLTSGFKVMVEITDYGDARRSPEGKIIEVLGHKDDPRVDILSIVKAYGILYFLDESKIAEEERYDGLYAVCTDLFDDNPADLLKVSEGRWQIEACFRIMKTDFEARPVYVRREDCIQAHFLICFLSLLVYRLLEKKLGGTYTCCEILDTLRSFKFADVQGQGFIPVYEVTELTDRLHELLGFATDYEFLTKSRMKTIEKLSKQR